MSAPPDVTGIAEQVACCSPDLDASDQIAQLALLRLLADGEPVEPAQLARAVGMGTAKLSARVGRWHGVHTDEAGRLVAFQGLSVVEAPHRLRIDGRTLYAWCAWDTLFLPELIGRSADIESTCPVTGQRITLRVEADGPTNVEPSAAVLSFVLPDSRFRDDTIASFCSLIHYLASPEAAQTWTAERADTFVISIDDGFEIGRRTNVAQWGEAIGSRERVSP